MPKDPRIGGTSVNDLLFDLALEHAVSIENLKSSEVRKALDLLAEVDEELLVQITGRVERLGPLERQLFGAGKYTTVRLKKLRTSLRALADRSYDIFIGHLRPLLDDISKESASFERATFDRTINPVIKGEFVTTAVSANTLRAVVRQTPIEGEVLRPYVRGWADAKKRRVEREIRKGVFANEVIGDIVNRITGPDGFVRSRRSAEGIVRTAVQAISEAARQEVWKANSDVIKGLRWVATFDNKLCVRCAGLAAEWGGEKLLPIDSGPRSPIHPNDRCVLVAVTTASNVPGERASAFGTVSKNITTDEFFKVRGAAFQDDVLGPTRGRLYRKGELQLNDFVDKSGREFTVDNLRSRHAQAFERAGL